MIEIASHFSKNRAHMEIWGWWSLEEKLSLSYDMPEGRIRSERKAIEAQIIA
jgi:hypothetical protein